MQIFIELTIGFVMAIIIYNVLHHFLVTIPDRKYQIAVKKQVDNEVFQIISELKDEKSVLVIDRFINSSVLTSVWGRGVMVFEYRCHVKNDYDLKFTRTTIDNKLRQQAYRMTLLMKMGMLN